MGTNVKKIKKNYTNFGVTNFGQKKRQKKEMSDRQQQEGEKIESTSIIRALFKGGKK